MSCCDGEDDEEQPQPSPRVRGCTDVFWLCLFIAFWFLMIMIAAFAIVYGNPLRLINGSDSFGNTCGMKNNQKLGQTDLYGQDTSDKPYLFHLDIKDFKQSRTICVKKCPDRTMNSMADVCKFYQDTGSKLCHYRVEPGFSPCDTPADKWNKNETYYCPKMPVYDSRPILNRCVPRVITDTTKKLVSNIYGDVLNSWPIIEQFLGDLYKTWREILALSILAFIFSLFMIAIFHLMASIVTWVVILLVSIASIGGTSLLWMTYFRIKFTLDMTDESQLLDESVRNERFFLIFSIIATVITVILLLLICFLRSRIEFMNILFRESAKCLAELPGLFIQPILTFIALLLFYTFWIIVFLCLATANNPTTKSISKLNSSGHFQMLNVATEVYTPFVEPKKLNVPIGQFNDLTVVEYVDPTWVKYMWWVYFIGFIWVSEFIIGCQNLIIAGAVAQWYFRGKEDGKSPVCSAIGKLFSYHLGSVACGSLLITIFKIPRLIMTYLHEKFEKTKDTSPCSQCGLKCCICCFYCLEKFIRFMNQNAYTVVAIEGTNFCKSARIAFSTLVSNALQLAVVNGVGDFILFLGKCFVTAATGSIALLFMRQDPKLHFYAVPIFVVCVISFFISHCVISLYETIIDTLFLCVCEDKNLNGDNGKWRQFGLAQIGNNDTSTNGHEMTPMVN